MNQEPAVVKAFEKVDFPLFGVKGAVAKIDTGAYSGALHATRIKVTRVDGVRLLHFSPHRGKRTTLDKFRMQHVKSSDGAVEKRYVVDTTVTIRGKDYPISITLSDRTGMRRKVLIGRKFLRQQGFIVDVSPKVRVR
jgi:hypothetical protein